MKLGMFMLWTDSVWAPYSPGSRPVASVLPPILPRSANAIASDAPVAPPSSVKARRARPVIEDEATVS